MLPKSKHRFIVILAFLMMLVASSSAASFRVGGLRLQMDVKPLRDIKRENIVTQSLEYSCGAAGLSTLLNFYLNDPVSEQDILLGMNDIVSQEKVRARQGFSLFDLKSYALSRGYKVTGYKMDVDFLKELNKPVLVPITFRKFRHFVIVKAVMGGRVFIADPAAGNMSMKVDQFEKIWTNGIGLVVEGHEADDEARQYALKVDHKDFIITDFRNLKNLMSRGIRQTKIHTTEW